MTKQCKSLSFTAIVATVIAMMSWGSALQAQQTDPRQQTTPQTQQPPDTQAPAPQQSPTPQSPDQAQPSQTPDRSQSPSSASPSSASPSSAGQSGASTEFVGTVVKQGDKYVLQDAASGATYDIDHQDEVKKFEGKRVRVKGTLDPSTKTIHVQ